MSDSPNLAFGKLVPGFDFLQNLATSAAKGVAQGIPQLPTLGNWVAPTLNVEDIDKRIGELKAVQFWLNQNATVLKATIQALEVQKMTLSTLKSMNFDVSQMAEAFKLKLDAPLAAPAAPAALPRGARVRKAPARHSSAEGVSQTVGAVPPGGVIDPMQWWGALTQQFQGIAASAMKEVAQQAALDGARNTASSLNKGAVKTAGGRAAAAKPRRGAASRS